MGADLSSLGTERSLHTRDGCYMVTDWLCEFHDDRRPIDEQMGSWDFPPAAVAAADAVVPMDYAVALSGGFVPESFFDDEPDWREGAWLECRMFLREAAAANAGIYGSY